MIRDIRCRVVALTGAPQRHDNASPEGTGKTEDHDATKKKSPGDFALHLRNHRGECATAVPPPRLPSTLELVIIETSAEDR